MNAKLTKANVRYEPISYSINPGGSSPVFNSSLDRWLDIAAGCSTVLYLLKADSLEKSFDRAEAQPTGTTFLLRPADVSDLEKLAAASLYLLADDINRQIEINNEKTARKLNAEI